MPEIGNHIIGKIENSSYFYLTLLKPEVTDADPAPTTDGPTMLTSFTPCGDSGTTATNLAVTATSGPEVASSTGKTIGLDLTFLVVGAVIGAFITTGVFVLIVVVKKMQNKIRKKPLSVAAATSREGDGMLTSESEANDDYDDEQDKIFPQANRNILRSFSCPGKPPAPPRSSPQSPRRSSGE